MNRLVLLGLQIALLAFLTWQIVQSSYVERELKTDRIELSKIQYGLFNTERWKEIVVEIVRKKTENISLSPEEQRSLELKIQGYIRSFFEDFKNNRPLLGAAMGLLLDEERQIQNISKRIVTTLNDPATMKEVQAYGLEKIEELAQNNLKPTDYSGYIKVLAKYQAEKTEQAQASIEGALAEQANQVYVYKALLVVLCVLNLLYLLFVPRLERGEYGLLSLSTLFFLACGLFLPMIEMDARIERLSFFLMGEAIVFENQVLYYKSKSILEVIGLMFQSSKFDLRFIGFLVLTFSVLFPLTKLTGQFVYLYQASWRQKTWLQFLVFRTGKWSMADVMVVAIFMAYIGFSGIISEQLAQLEALHADLEVLSTNASALQFGFYAFTLFTLQSLLLTHRLQYQTKLGQILIPTEVEQQ